MEIYDQVIIDGNAVYEIDNNCTNQMNVVNQIKSTDLQNDNNQLFKWMLLLALFL